MQPIEVKGVVAAVDFSKWTSPVLHTAAEIAGRYGAKLTVVHAEMIYPPAYFAEREIGRISAHQEEAQRYLVDTVRKEVGDQVALEARFRTAMPVNGILTTAEEVDAGLIVMGTHGRSGLNRLLMGSVAEKVVRKAEVPVLTVRGTGKDAIVCALPFRKILCPVNFTDAARESLRYAGDLAQRFGAELTVMTSVEGETTYATIRQQEQELFDWIPKNVQAGSALNLVVRWGDAAAQIIRTVWEERNDLIVIGAQHRPFLETTIFGTTSVQVMRHAACPVLTVVRH